MLFRSMTSCRQEGVVFAAYDSPASIDKIAAEYMGYSDKHLLEIAKNFLSRKKENEDQIERILPSYGGIYHIKLASEFGLGTIYHKKIKIHTEYNDEKATFNAIKPKVPFEPPETLFDGTMTTEYNEVPFPDEYIDIPLYHSFSVTTL